MKVVVDTSAIIAVLFGEAHRESILQHTEDVDLIAPGSLRWEIGNAFSAMFKRERLGLEAALEAAAHYRDIPIQFVEVELDEAIRLSEQQDIYAYDAYMLSVAKRHRAPLLTLDGGLKEAARQNNVKLLEIDYESIHVFGSAEKTCRPAQPGERDRRSAHSAERRRGVCGSPAPA